MSADSVTPRADGPAFRGFLGRRRPGPTPPRVKLYDFKRPDKFSKEQIRTMEILHETFARLAGTRLSQKLRQPSSLKVTLVDQMTFGEYMDSVATPSLLAVGSMKPLKGPIVLHLDLAARESMVERLFGAPLGGMPGQDLLAAAPAARDITDIECGCLEGLLGELFPLLGSSWEPVEAVESGLLNIETDPRFCQLVPPPEMIILVGLELELAGTKARLNLVYPFLTIEPLVPRLSAQRWYAAARAGDRPAPSLAAAWRLENPAELLFRGESLSIAGLRGLRRGSLVAMPGLDRGIGQLRSGNAEVLALRLREARRDGRLLLEVLEESPSANPPAELLPELGGGGADAAVHGLERSLEALRASFERSLAGLGEGLKRLEGRQEDLGDRLLYGGGELAAEEPRAAATRPPFASLAASPSESLAAFLASERPQLVALILSWLDDNLASRVLDGLPAEMRPETLRRLAVLDRVAPELLAEVERILSLKLDTMSRSEPASGGVAKIVGMLNLSPRATEKQVIESLELLDPSLAEDLKRNMFVFEDIVLLDDESIDAVIGAAEEKDLLLALKLTEEPVRERIFGRMGGVLGPEAEARLRAEFARLGRVRLTEADAAGMRVVALIRTLEEEGRIFIAREGEGIEA